MTYYYGFLFSIIVNSTIWMFISFVVNKYCYKSTGFKDEKYILQYALSRLNARTRRTWQHRNNVMYYIVFLKRAVVEHRNNVRNIFYCCRTSTTRNFNSSNSYYQENYDSQDKSYEKDKQKNLFLSHFMQQQLISMRNLCIIAYIIDILYTQCLLIIINSCRYEAKIKESYNWQ